MADRVPPHSLDAEGAVLSAVMLERSAFESVASALKPEDFYSEPNRRIFEAALWLHEQNQPIDVLTIVGRLRETERINQVGGAVYVGQLVDTVPSVANVEHYAAIVRDKAVKRAVIAVCQKAVAEGFLDQGTAAEFADSTEHAIYEINRPAKGADLEHVQPVTARVIREITEAAARGERLTGKPTGFERYDAKTAGLHDGELTIVAARPGVGKTAWVTNVIVNVASHVAAGNEGHADATEATSTAVALFSLEMSREAIANRMLCSEARVDLGKMRQGYLNIADWERLTPAANFLCSLPIWIDDTAGLTVLEARAKLRRLQAEIGRTGMVQGKPCERIGLVVLDYLQLMSPIGENLHSRQQEIGSISRGLKRLAKELRVPVVALSQLNRSVEVRGGNARPRLSDLREAGDIEQDADNVIFIHRDDAYDPEAENRGIAELIIGKQRNGPIGTIKVRWSGEYTRFDNLAPHEFPEEVA